MLIDDSLSPAGLLPRLDRLWDLSARCLRGLDASFAPGRGAPVFTVEGRYTSRGWTEWTQGFWYGSYLLQYDATGEEEFLGLGRRRTVTAMPDHVTHTGVHDHGFTVVSTYGALRRMILEGRFPATGDELAHYELALRVSGAVQASRWSTTAHGDGYLHSFNGPHSLFVDTVRSCRSLGLAHRLGHVLLGERDRRISLLGRAIEHLRSTARWNVFYGEGRDAYDVRGRTAHEAIFDVTDGTFRCPATQQGWSPFTTWTRGLAWAVLGFPEQLEFLDTVPDDELEPFGGRASITHDLLRAALATADHYLDDATASDGVPYWDTGAPDLHRLGDWRSVPADPGNPYEPVDSSAAAIAAQGLLRLGTWLSRRDGAEDDGTARRYRQAGLTIAARLMEPPYLNEREDHQGLLLHSVYHRPGGWDHVAPGQRVPNGESGLWGDYHLRELALYLGRQARG
ncbi:MAG: unsaturated chondroitin disaccharide hydrolase, partial [Actinomycetota bacterium]|nr:unsaturated chondroitin disaccharide hydrolase [Actinomycetota bacterium]